MSETSDIIKLTFSPDNLNPVNCSLVNDQGETLYRVVTEFQPKDTITTVRNASQDVIASLQWRDHLPDKVTIGDKKPLSLGDWMKRSLIPFVDHLSFTDDLGRQYKWKGNSADRSLELYTQEDDYKEPIAAFRKKRRMPNPEDPEGELIWTSAMLILNQRAVEIQDIAVTSFLFLEKSRRTNERAAVNVADVLGHGASSLGLLSSG